MSAIKKSGDPDKDGDKWSSSIFAETSRDAGKAWGFDVEQGLAAGDDPTGISHSLSAGICAIALSVGMNDNTLQSETYLGSESEFGKLREKFSALSETEKSQAVIKALVNIHDT